ncbi:MAG: hypothetical protein E6G44_04145 [Actinobacteria bacterium]|nr:MAG: hypothetical protein E6G44_04145 [Actinomycetota bacterium]
MDFQEALSRYGFIPAQERPSRGSETYVARPTGFLTYSVHVYEDGTALFTWEFAITDYLQEHGMQLGSGEALNVYLYPVEDDRGPQDADWLTHAIEKAETQLRSVDLTAA